MNTHQLSKLGVKTSGAFAAGSALCKHLAHAGLDDDGLRDRVSALIAGTAAPVYPVEKTFVDALALMPSVERAEPAPWRQWGSDLEEGAIDQMRHAVRLPVSVAGALMPDAHVGYGLPIGGVLATEGAVIPYAVGVDIACRMKMTLIDMPADALDDDARREKLISALNRETLFGVGQQFKKPHEHDVLDRDWTVSPITKEMKRKAQGQLGTSGSGNHFVEWGELTVTQAGLPVPKGRYLALLSHSGSRGTGAAVCDHYSKLAKQMHPDLPRELANLAWLPLDTEAGAEYWAAMELMGHYASANHACIHRAVVKHVGAEVLWSVENHHNFAWKETHFGREVVVHRKGATPAGAGVFGVIPGSMASPAYIVRGRGQAESMNSASHGAGRVMSRTRAFKELNWDDARRLLTEKRVHLMSASLDEVPFVYKDIHSVMAAQQDLVETVAQFDPRIVKMAPAGERPED